MTDYKYNPDYAAHPSEYLREWFDTMDTGVLDLDTRWDRALATAILQGGSVGEFRAGRLEEITGIDANFWLNLQDRYDEVHG